MSNEEARHAASGGVSDMRRTEVVLHATSRLNALRVTTLVRTAMQYDAVINLKVGSMAVSAASFLGVMSLGIAPRAVVTLIAEGRDASAALQAIEGLLR